MMCAHTHIAGPVDDDEPSFMVIKMVMFLSRPKPLVEGGGEWCQRWFDRVASTTLPCEVHAAGPPSECVCVYRNQEYSVRVNRKCTPYPTAAVGGGGWW